MADSKRQAKRAELGTGGVDPWLVASALTLLALGLIMVTSASVATGEGRLGGIFHYGLRQSIFIGLGSLISLLLIVVSTHHLERLSRLALLGVFGCLLVVFVPGVGSAVNGSLRWIQLGPMRFQMVEAAKLLMVIYVAGYLVRHRETMQERFMGVVKPLIVALVAAGLLLLQPDYGSAVLIVAIVGLMVWLAGARWRHVGLLALLVAPLMAAAVVLEPYRLRRLTSFLDPWSDPYADGFQLTQALIAVGRGEWLGVGLGASVQKLHYLPEAHTDFIFAVLAEELGLLGVTAVLLLFGVLVWRIMLLGLKAVENDQPFAGYLAWGIGLWLGLQALISIGVNLGVLPTKGITLPMVSYGGSSVMMTCIAVALLLRISYEVRAGIKPPKKRIAGKRRKP